MQSPTRCLTHSYGTRQLRRLSNRIELNFIQFLEIRLKELQLKNKLLAVAQANICQGYPTLLEPVIYWQYLSRMKSFSKLLQPQHPHANAYFQNISYHIMHVVITIFIIIIIQNIFDLISPCFRAMNSHPVIYCFPWVARRRPGCCPKQLPLQIGASILGANMRPIKNSSYENMKIKKDYQPKNSEIRGIPIPMAFHQSIFPVEGCIRRLLA